MWELIADCITLMDLIIYQASPGRTMHHSAQWAGIYLGEFVDDSSSFSSIRMLGFTLATWAPVGKVSNCRNSVANNAQSFKLQILLWQTWHVAKQPGTCKVPEHSQRETRRRQTIREVNNTVKTNALVMLMILLFRGVLNPAVLK